LPPRIHQMHFRRALSTRRFRDIRCELIHAITQTGLTPQPRSHHSFSGIDAPFLFY